jgi:hypothetical protein
MADQGVKNRVLIVGKSQQEKFVEELLKRQLEWNAAHKTRTIVHTLDTKYYTADIEFWLHHEDLLEHELNAIGELTDALILTYNTHKGTIVDLSKKWLSFIEEHVPNVIIIVYDGRNGDDALTEQEQRQIQSWAVDNNMEFIYLTNDTSNNVDEDEEDERFKEKEGLERVIEALETNMWENMVHKTSNRPHVGLSQLTSHRHLARDDSDEELDEELFKGLQVAEPPTLNNNVTPADTNTNAKHAIAATEEKKSEEVQVHTSAVNGAENKNAESATVDPIEANPLLNGAIFKQLNDSAGESFDTFDKALSELRTLRQQASALPDEQRRDLAARVAMAFLQFTDDDE